MYGCFAIMYVYVACVYGALRSQKRALEPLEMELQIDGCEPSMWMLGIKLSSPGRATSTLKC